jgi:hypothetical protein
MLTTASAPADDVALLIEGLCRAIAARGAARGLAGPFIILVWSRLRRMAGRVSRLAARFRAGNLPAPRARRRRPRPAAPPDPSKRLPRGFAWLTRMVPEVAAGGSQLGHLLGQPEMAALIAAAPQAGRILRPLCRMLGIDHPPLRLPRRPRAPPPSVQADAAGPEPPAGRPPPLRPTRAWLLRTSLPGRGRPRLIPAQA